MIFSVLRSQKAEAKSSCNQSFKVTQTLKGGSGPSPESPLTLSWELLPTLLPVRASLIHEQDMD